MVNTLTRTRKLQIRSIISFVHSPIKKKEVQYYSRLKLHKFVDEIDDKTLSPWALAFAYFRKIFSASY